MTVGRCIAQVAADGYGFLCFGFVIAVALYFGMIVVVTKLRNRAPRRVLDTGECALCGYDLTGNVSGTCPECGTKVG